MKGGRRKGRRRRPVRKRHHRRYTCICQAGFTGLFCHLRYSACASRPCLYGQLCVDIDGGRGYSCESTSAVVDVERGERFLEKAQYKLGITRCSFWRREMF